MKKTIILFGFIGFSTLSFSQVSVANENDNNVVSKATNLSTNKAILKCVKIGEKIQTTEEGMVMYKKAYALKYPTLMIDPEKQPIKNTNQLQNK